MSDLFLRACRRQPVERPPVWMMRQAGRYLPQYRAVRSRADFLTMVRTPELAAEVTLQPVDLLGVDAAIIFSDILVIPEAMGMALTVEEGSGPRFPEPIGSARDLERLREVDVERGLSYVLDAIGLVRERLAGRVPVIGFAGAPWTLMSYMVEGSGTRTFTRAKRFLVEQPDGARALLQRLAGAVGRFLVAQVAAGAQAVQLFDSWAARLSRVRPAVPRAGGARGPGDRGARHRVRAGSRLGARGDRPRDRRGRDRRGLADRCR
jgi:uroporphyrinogen decarboxylase